MISDITASKSHCKLKWGCMDVSCSVLFHYLSRGRCLLLKLAREKPPTTLKASKPKKKKKRSSFRNECLRKLVINQNDGVLFDVSWRPFFRMLRSTLLCAFRTRRKKCKFNNNFFLLQDQLEKSDIVWCQGKKKASDVDELPLVETFMHHITFPFPACNGATSTPDIFSVVAEKREYIFRENLFSSQHFFLCPIIREQHEIKIVGRWLEICVFHFCDFFCWMEESLFKWGLYQQ